MLHSTPPSLRSAVTGGSAHTIVEQPVRLWSCLWPDPEEGFPDVWGVRDVWNDRSMTAGIAAWGTYLPFWRLQRSAIAGVLGSGGGRGTRPWPPTTRTRPRWASRPADGRWPSDPGPKASRTSSFRRPTPGTWTRRAPRPCTPRWASAGVPAPMTSPAPRARPSGRCCLRWVRPAPAAPPCPSLRTFAPVSLARPRSATAAMPPPHSSAHPTAQWRSWSGGARPVTSSSIAGACRERPTRTSGRSASARRCTCRWPARPLLWR